MQRRQQQRWLAGLAVVLAMVDVLAGWTWVANSRATSLRIIAHGIIVAYDGPDDSALVTPATPFDKTITDLKLVSELQGQMDNLPPYIVYGGGCGGGTIEYRYEFIFATLGVTTQTYAGTNYCADWSAVSPEWGPVVAPFASRDVGSPLRLPLVKQLGVPLGK